MLRLRRSLRGDRSFDLLRVPLVVIVEERDEVTAGGFEASVACRASTPVLLVTEASNVRYESVVELREHLLYRFIGVVVDDDDFYR